MATFDAVFASWPARPWLAIVLLLSAGIYTRGWRILRRRDPERWQWAHLAAFLAALAATYVALAGPIETFAPLLLQVHMVQHLLLTMAIPPLLWLGAPMFPLLRGLPREVRRYWIGPLLRVSAVRQLGTAITYPTAAWLIFVATTWLWHLPGAYELALGSDAWHVVQHVCFLAAGLIFWYPVVRPFPARPAWSLWLLVPYLLLADVQNTVLSALFTFSDQVFYPHYLAMPRLAGVSALADQSTAGVMMWVPGSIAFLLPLAWIGVRLLRPSMEQSRKSEVRNRTAIFRPATPDFRPRGSFDLLQLPILGSLFRWRCTRRVAQFVALLIVAAVIVDGLAGPRAAPMNLAGVVPWIHWRGLVIFGLLAVGNVFCYACPFMLPRTIARRWLPADHAWPRWLRTKWLAVALLVIFLWAYEAYSLWDSPWLTAWIALAYFAGALVVDGWFRGAAFCKYVCPIGQFHFVQSIVSPLEVRVREPAVCAGCRTHDCLHGHGKVGGCELHLFQPRKAGNLDCTFCLDCVSACPRDNVGVLAVVPTSDLWREGLRSGIGLLGRRVDYAALAAVLVFGALANAAGMVAPVVDTERAISGFLGWSGTFLTTTLFYGLALLVIPLLAIVAATTASRRLALGDLGAREIACRFVWCLVPLGFAMWLAHYSFHFFTSFDTIVPVTQRFVADLGLGSGGSPDWTCACCRPAPDWLLKTEIMMLDVGLLASLYASWRVGVALTTGARGRAAKAVAPWVVLLAILFAVGVWILLEPMEMRGTIA